MKKEDKIVSIIILGIAFAILIGRPLIINKIVKESVEKEKQSEEKIKENSEQSYDDYVRAIMENGAKVENDEMKKPLRSWTV